VSYTINGISAKAKINHFIDKTKLFDLINDFKIDNAEDFIAAIGKCKRYLIYCKITQNKATNTILEPAVPFLYIVYDISTQIIIFSTAQRTTVRCEQNTWS
jgi:hypothetical protein